MDRQPTDREIELSNFFGVDVDQFVGLTPRELGEVIDSNRRGRGLIDEFAAHDVDPSVWKECASSLLELRRQYAGNRFALFLSGIRSSRSGGPKEVKDSLKP